MTFAHANPVAHGSVFVLCCVALAIYGVAWLAAARRSAVRLWCWAGGLVTLVAATAPRVEAWASATFTGHMVQHLLLIVVAAPQLVLARPAATIAARWPFRWQGSSTHRRTARWWRRTGPLAASAVFVATLYVTHLSGIYDAALGNPLVHDLEHLAYLSAACLLWAAMTTGGRLGAPLRVGAVFGVIGSSALLGVVLLSAPTPLIATYARQLGEEAARRDQRAAASLMWVGAMALTVPLLLVSVWRWAATEQRIAARSEAARDAEASAAPPPRQTAPR